MSDAGNATLLKDLGTTPLLKDRVYHAIKGEIISGRFAPGMRLNILELANTMNISCAPVREALNMLSKDGLVELSPHKQAVVAMGRFEDFETTLELRKMLEPYAAKISTPLIPQSKIDEVRVMLNAVLANPYDLVAYAESDTQIHEMLHAYYGSKTLSDILNTLKTNNMRFRYSVERSANDREQQAATCVLSTNEHIVMLEAINSRDPESAYRATLIHIERYGERNRIQNSN